jgi:hypothetical protein
LQGKGKFRLRGHTLPRDARWQWRLARLRSLVRAKARRSKVVILIPQSREKDL